MRDPNLAPGKPGLARAGTPNERFLLPALRAMTEAGGGLGRARHERYRVPRRGVRAVNGTGYFISAADRAYVFIGCVATGEDRIPRAPKKADHRFSAGSLPSRLYRAPGLCQRPPQWFKELHPGNRSVPIARFRVLAWSTAVLR